MEQTISSIKTALINSLSLDATLRDQANEFLMKQCEPDPQFQIALLHIIKSFGQAAAGQNTILDQSGIQGAPSAIPQPVPAGSPSPEDIQIQYQAIICMKNSLTRLLQQHRGRNFTSSRGATALPPQQQTLSTSQMLLGSKSVAFANQKGPGARRSPLAEELRSQIKAQLLQMIDSPDNVILSKSSYDQLTLVVTIFVKYDFPAQWPQMNQWLLRSLEQLYTNMQSLQLEDAPRVQRFLGFYFEVLKEQRKKQLNNSKSHFFRVSKDHLQGLARVWTFFNQQQRGMIFNEAASEVQISNYNESLFAIAAKLDKCLMVIVGCGFSINNLVAEPDNNAFVETVTQLIQKLKLYVTCVEQASALSDSEDKEKFKTILVGQVKTFLKNLCSLQSAEPLIMFNSLDQYLQILAQILVRNELYPMRVNKLALIATFKVVNVACFNQGSSRDATGHSDGIGILVSPVKFKNLEPQIAKASELYRQVMEAPIPNSDLEEERSRQDGARKILELVTKHFLSQVDLSQWQADPEYFIENEDEQFLLEYDLQDDCSLNLLAQHLIEKLLQKFYHTCYPFVQEIFNQYFAGQLPLDSVKVEDAILNLVGIIGKVQREFKVKLEKRLDVNYVLQFIKVNKWQAASESAPIFRRRFLLILTHWVKLVPKPIFLDLFNQVLQSLAEFGTAQGQQQQHLSTLDQVLVFEHSHCVHEMLKELHYWLTRAQNNSSQFHDELPKDIFELRGSSEMKFTESEEDQISYCQYIHSQVNYAQLFQLMCSKLVPLLDVFKAPNLIWSIINCMSFVLEQIVDQNETIEECLKYMNILRILQQQTECHVEEAVIDMLKNLLILCPASPVILDMCCVLLDFKLSKTLNDGSTIQFWLFTMRAVSAQNPNLQKLKDLFLRFSGCLTISPGGAQAASTTGQGGNSVANTTIKRDYIYLEFLKVAQEAILLNMFATFEEASQLTAFATFKFESEVEAERKAFLAKEDSNGTSSGADSCEDSEDGLDTTIYEKKAHILMLPYVIIWKAESSPVVDATLQTQKNLLVQCCCYLIESKAVLTLPCSNIFFQQLLTYVNRVLIMKPDDFVTGILMAELSQRSLTFEQFVEAWLAKMDMIISWEAHRIKCLALLIVLPFMSAELLREHFAQIGRILFSRLENELFFKLTNDKTRANYSPSRFKDPCKKDFHRNPNAVKINIVEKVSQRYEQLKREDWLLDCDLMDIFWEKIRAVMAKHGTQTIDPFLECLGSEDLLKEAFQNLMNGFSPKFERLKKEQQEQEAQERQQLQQQQQNLLAAQSNSSGPF